MGRYFLWLVSLVVVIVSGTGRRAMANTPQSDSLLKVINNYKTHDTTLVNYYVALSRLYQQINQDSMYFFARNGLDIATEIKFEKGRALSLQLMGTASFGQYAYDDALKSYHNGTPLFDAIKDYDGLVKNYIYIAKIKYRLVKLDTAALYFKKAIAVCESTGFTGRLAVACNNLGVLYSDMGNYPEALKYLLKGLTKFEEEKNNEGVAECLSKIAGIYASLDNVPKTLEYINLYLKVDQSGANIEHVVNNHVSIGNAYTQIKDYKNAIVYFSKGAVIADSTNSNLPYWKSVCLLDMAEAYRVMGDFENALVNYAKALKDSAQISDVSLMASMRSGIGTILVKKGQVKAGISHLLAAYNIKKDNNMKVELLLVSAELSNAYEMTGDYKKSVQFYKISNAWKDSMHNEASEKKIQQLQFDYELGKKQSQIELLNKNELVEQSRRDRRIAVMWALISVLVSFGIIIILLNRSREKEIRNRELVYRQKEELQLQAARLEELNHFKDKTFSVLSHDLRGPLATFTTTMMLLDENIISHDEFTELKPVVDKQLNSLNILLDNLLKWSKSYIMGEIATRPVPVTLRSVAEANISLVQDAAETKKITIHNNIPAGITAYVDEGQVDIVIRNLISNALKFTREGGNVILNAVETGGKVCLSVADDGVGMTDAQLKKLFTTTPDNTTYGTKGEKGIGLGLLLCHEFIKANSGTITAESEVGKGTTFYVIVPKSNV
ncbi:MAG: tetratricopeptide repeat protein [Taibaiella sp.]|nr:tetratricopeptide repeat protein [Taibaiella sp.]